MKKIFYFFAFVAIFAVASCDNTQDNPCEVAFDQSAMFQNYTNSLIIPAYTDLKEKVVALATATDDFTNTPTSITLEALQNTLFDAYLVWQVVAQYDLGPAEEVFLRNSVNNFPLDTAQVLENIQSGSYNFDTPDEYDKGFPALDYLLHNTYDDNAAILERFTTNSDASTYIQYLSDVVADIQSRVEHTYDAWVNGDYANTFNTNTGTAAGSSLSLLVNDFNENYELIKRDKVGIASGILTLGFTNPTKTEAYYSGRSLELAKAALEASLQMYLGKNGLGLDDYLDAIGAEKDGQSLNQVIQNQFAAAETALNALSGRLSDEVENNTANVETAYNELSKQLVHIKTDMPSVMCIAITYIDNPSDSD